MLDSLIPLPLRLPPGHLWERAMGYWGDARFIGVYEDCGSAYFSDGRLTATADWAGFVRYVRHSYARFILRNFPALAENESGVAALWLVLDTRQGRLYVAPRKEAMTVLAQQWPQAPEEAAILVYESDEELVQLAEAQIRKYEEEQQRHRPEQRKAQARLERWLESQMSNNERS